jgi:hypothetical protein
LINDPAVEVRAGSLGASVCAVGRLLTVKTDLAARVRLLHNIID